MYLGGWGCEESVHQRSVDEAGMSRTADESAPSSASSSALASASASRSFFLASRSLRHLSSVCVAWQCSAQSVQVEAGLSQTKQ